MPELIDAVKREKLSYISFETRLMCLTVESTLPEYIDTYAYMAKKIKTKPKKRS